MIEGSFVLIVRRGDETETHSYTQDVVSIGRSSENDLVLADRLVSRNHCRVERRDGRVLLIDAGAQNPARLNGLPVDESELHYGDIFRIGESEIQLMEPVPLPQSLDETEQGDAQQSAKDLAAIMSISRALNEEQDLSRLLTAIVDAGILLTGAERGFMILGEGKESTVEVARNFAQEEIHTPEFKISRTIAQRVRESGVAELTTNAQDDARFSALASVTDLRLRSILCIPIRIRNQTEGVLYVDNRLQNQVFREREKELMMSLADQAGVALLNAQTMRELRTNKVELEGALNRVDQLNAALRGQVNEQRLELAQMKKQIDSASHGNAFRYDYRNIVGDCRRMREVFGLLDKYIPAREPVMILGESGTGKELVARAIHALSDRSKAGFVSENCAALPESLLESELFGYVKGAFTGANQNRKGMLEAADGGVLFLDEIGDMHIDLQKKLLRVLQEGEVRPLGSQRTIKVDFRLVTATNRNLEEMIREGEFREDLFYRLHVLPVTLPPLRERREDIPALVDRFLREMSRESGGPLTRITLDALETFGAHRWPGNVRELQNEIRRAAILSDGVILESHLSESVRNPSPDPAAASSGPVPAERGTTLPDLVRDLEVAEISKALSQAGGNKSRTAEMLGVSRFALQRKLDKYEIHHGEPAGEMHAEEEGSTH